MLIAQHERAAQTWCRGETRSPSTRLGGCERTSSSAFVVKSALIRLRKSVSSYVASSYSFSGAAGVGSGVQGLGASG